MAAANRNPTGDLTDRLFEQPWEFELHQAIRLLDRLLGRNTRICFQGDASLEFPAAEIADISRLGFFDEVSVRVRTQALVGALGVLPHWYSELVLERLKSHDSSLAGFFDLFVNRLVRLEYEACAAVTPALIFERERWKGDPSQFTELLRAALGIVDAAILPIDERDLHACGALAARRPVSARVLEQILEERLAVPVTIRELTGGWYPVPPENRVHLGGPPGGSGTLGETAVLGDAVLVPPAAITVEIGPLSVERAGAFCREGFASDWARCRHLIAFLLGEALDFVVDLLVDSSETPGCVLGEDEPSATHLGVNMWLHSPYGAAPARTRIWPRHNPGEN